MPTINQISYKATHKKQSKSKTAKKHEKRAASKENANSGFRVRKVFMGVSSASKISHKPISSTNTTINLLTTSKEHKQNHLLLKPTKQASQNKKRDTSSHSVKEPKIINKISHKQQQQQPKEEIIKMPQVV